MFSSRLHRFWQVVLLAAVLSFSFAATARDFPRNAKQARFNQFERPIATLGSTALRLAHNVRVIDENNKFSRPSRIPIGAKVVYQLDGRSGEVEKIWVLGAEEVVNIRQ